MSTNQASSSWFLVPAKPIVFQGFNNMWYIDHNPFFKSLLRFEENPVAEDQRTRPPPPCVYIEEGRGIYLHDLVS